LILRRYRPSDRAACLVLFQGNVPEAFLEAEVAEFAAFVDRLPGPYFVVLDASETPVACGGLAVRDDAANLCWGLVDVRRHREGIGRLLLRVRLALSARKEGIARVTMNTSQVSAPFFLREGFATLHTVPNYFRVGLDRHDLELQLTGEARRAIDARLTETLAQGHGVEQGLFDAPWETAAS
jgi:hypothetical protein